MDDSYRLKIKIGPHEFEAEGPANVVREQFQSFKDLLVSLPAISAIPQVDPPPPANGAHTPQEPPKPELIAVDSSLGKIMRVNERVVSLTAPPADVQSAVLVILYGQKILRQNDDVTGAEIMDGLSDTGRFTVGRVDRILENLAAVGNVIVIGERRKKRYRLTLTGLKDARIIANDLLAIVA